MRAQTAKMFLWIIIVAISISSCKPAEEPEKSKPMLTYFNAEKLYQTCKNYNKEVDEWAIEDELSSKICLGYVGGLIDSTNTALDSCVGKLLQNLSIQKFILVFNKFIKQNPKYLKSRASDILVVSVTDAYAKEIHICREEETGKKITSAFFLNQPGIQKNYNLVIAKNQNQNEKENILNRLKSYVKNYFQSEQN